ncbi:MAG TPA: putative glycolipid-binding domain-containing protein [Longimicrobiales bacterium]|nr:putative glycolipid-binding domain-containing protein [Longimicrobiales bacterium]
MRRILWHFPRLPSMERCNLIEDAAANRLEGTVLTLLEAQPALIQYSVTCDSDWSTRDCTVRIEAGDSAADVELSRNSQGLWFRAGEPAPEFDGCMDVDLGFSPCTNTLPIRRLGLKIGAAARIAAVWLRFPRLDLLRSDQIYTRLDTNLYRYQSGDGAFTAELVVDDHGIVTQYADLWRELRGGA